MAGRERKYTPRTRSSRPLGPSRSSNKAPSTPLSPPTLHETGMWHLPNPLAQRLHEKSALGCLSDAGGILLTAEEVMFCHWYRHVPLPNDDLNWFDNEVRHHPDLALRTIGMDVLRNGGERVVPIVHLRHRFSSLNPSSWAIRWERHESWMHHPGFSQIRLQHTNDQLDWDELFQWVIDANQQGHVAELCVIDDEFDATVYHLSLTEPQGDHRQHSELTHDEHELLQEAIDASSRMETGYFLPTKGPWPLPSFGIEHFSGRYLREEEHAYLTQTGTSPFDNLFAALVEQGLMLRPGFKYGCRWRAYETAIEHEHAPWLIQPKHEAAKNWEEVCLSVRLAEGVNKRWLCAFPSHDGGFSFLNIKRSA